MTTRTDHGRGPAHTLREVADLCTMHNNYPLAVRQQAVRDFDAARAALIKEVHAACDRLEFAQADQLRDAAIALFGIDAA